MREKTIKRPNSQQHCMCTIIGGTNWGENEKT